MIKAGFCQRLLFVVIPVTLLAIHLLLAIGSADEHKGPAHHGKQYERGRAVFGFESRERKQVRTKDEGNQVTGQTAAWLLVAANLSVALSLLLKGANRFFALAPEAKSSIKRFNQLQKKHLMRFHYVFNPLALVIAFFHFLLSSCRTSALPEWGLIVVAVMVALGFMVKFRVTPKWMQRSVYRLHTGWAPISIMIVLLTVGHLIMK
jgi:hypothetical protein